MYIYKNRGFSPYNTGIEYTKTLFAEEKQLALYHSFSFCLPLFLFPHSPITHTYFEGYAFVKRGRASASYISLLYSFSVYGKSIKDYWFSFCIYYLSAFPESLQLFVSALLVRCGSALLINLILAMISFANVVILWFYPFYHIIAIKLVMAQSVGEKISARKIPLSYSFVMRYFIFLQLIISIFKMTIILTHYSHVYKLIHPCTFYLKSLYLKSMIVKCMILLLWFIEVRNSIVISLYWYMLYTLYHNHGKISLYLVA